MTPPAAPRNRPSGQHPWWRYVPPAERPRRRLHLLAMRLLDQSRRRRNQLLATLLFYVLLCLIPLHFGQYQLALLALLPLVAVPPVTYLAYLIAWHEFHR